MDFKRHQRQSCLSSLEKKPENPHIELISLECRHGGFCTHTKTSNTAPKVIVYKSYVELTLLVQCKRQHMYSRYLLKYTKAINYENLTLCLCLSWPSLVAYQQSKIQQTKIAIKKFSSLFKAEPVYEGRLKDYNYITAASKQP